MFIHIRQCTFTTTVIRSKIRSPINASITRQHDVLEFPSITSTDSNVTKIVFPPEIPLLTQLPNTNVGLPSPKSLPFDKPFTSTDEEKKVHSILHHVIFYNKETKPSKKILHLQLLSKTSFGVTELKYDRRFLALLKTIHNDVIPIAGANQLQIISASYTRLRIKTLKLWNALLCRTTQSARKHLVAKVPYHSSNISGPNVCVILSQIAKSGVRPYSHLITLFNHLAKVASELYPIDIEKALCAMHQLHMAPVQFDNIDQQRRLQTIKALCRRVEPYVASTPPVVLVRIIQHLSLMGFIPVSLIPCAIPHLTRSLRRLSPGSLSSLTLSFKIMKLWNPSLLYSLASVVASKAPKASPDALSLSLSSLVSQGVKKRKFLVPITREIEKWNVNTPNLSNRSIGKVSLSLGDAGCRIHSIWKSLGAIVQSRLDVLSPAEVSLYLHGMGAVGLRDRNAIQIIIPSIIKRVNNTSLDSIIALLDGFALLGLYDEEAITLLLSRYCQLDPNANIAQQTRMCRAMVTLLLEAPEIIKALPRSSQLVVERYQKRFEAKPKRSFHVHLSNCLKQLDVGFEVHFTEGPLSFDALISRRPGRLNQSRIGVDLLGPQHFCPVTSEILGHARLKRRLSQRQNIELIPINRLKWAKLATEEERIEHLSKALSIETLIQSDISKRLGRVYL